MQRNISTRVTKFVQHLLRGVSWVEMLQQPSISLHPIPSHAKSGGAAEFLRWDVLLPNPSLHADEDVAAEWWDLGLESNVLLSKYSVLYWAGMP